MTHKEAISQEIFTIISQASKKLDIKREEAIEGEISRLFKEKRVSKKGKRIDDKVKIAKKISDKSRKNKTLFLVFSKTSSITVEEVLFVFD